MLVYTTIWMETRCIKHKNVFRALIAVFFLFLFCGCISIQNRSDSIKSYKIDIEKIRAKIEQNNEFYTEHFLRFGKAPPPPIYIGLADITNDGKPEIFIGAVDIISVNVYYSTYDLDLNELNIGEIYTRYQDVPTSHFFMQTINRELFSSLKFLGKDNGKVRFLATATKGGIPAEYKNTIIEYANDSFTTKVLEWGTEDITNTPEFSKSEPLPTVQVEIDPDDIENSIKECIEKYESFF